MTLVTLRPGLTLESGAAASWARVEARTGRRYDVNSSLRNRAEQQRARDTWLAFNRNPTAWRRANPGKSDPPFALDPDDSNHVNGTAVDSDDAAQFEKDAWNDGWRRTALNIGEWWHLDYIPALDRNKGQTSSSGNAKPLDPTKGKLMADCIVTAPGCQPALWSPGSWVILDTPEKLSQAKKLCDREVKLGLKREWQVARALAIYAQTPATTVSLTAAQLAAIADAAQKGGASAVAALEFVVSATTE